MHPWHNCVHLESSSMLSTLIPYDVMQPASSGGRRKWGRMKCTATNDGNYGQVWRLPEKWDGSSPYSIVYEPHDAANRLRMNARRAHEWIGMFQKAWLDFSCELVLCSLIVQHFVTYKELYLYNRNTKLYACYHGNYNCGHGL